MQPDTQDGSKVHLHMKVAPRIKKMAERLGNKNGMNYSDWYAHMVILFAADEGMVWDE